MALDISNASIGLDKGGIKKVKDDIELNLIDESIKVIKNDVEALKNNIPNYWVGAAGKAFALKCESERSKVSTILRVLKAKVEIDLGTMAANTVLADAEVATAIWAMSGGGGSSAGGPSGGGNTPTPAPTIPDPSTEPPQNLEEDPTSTPEKDNQEAEDIDVDGDGGGGGTNGPIVPGEEPPKEPVEQPEPEPEEEKKEEEKPEEKPEEEPTTPTDGSELPDLDGGAGDGSEQPTEPVEPTQPTEPTEPVEPAEPAEPTEPVTPPTAGDIPGNHSPGTTDTTYPAQPYALDKNSLEYRELVATIYAEASENPDWIVSDTMGVCSTILNRVEAGNWGGSTIHDVVSAGGGAGQGQFHGYGAGNRKFDLAMADINNVPAAMLAAIDRVLAGERNTTGFSFWGDGVKTHFR